MGFMSIAFFLGLASLFVGMGASASFFGGLLREYMFSLTTAGGIIVVLFGFMTLFGKGFWSRLSGTPSIYLLWIFPLWRHLCFGMDTMCRTYSFRDSYSSCIRQNNFSRNVSSFFLCCWTWSSIDFYCNTLQQIT